MLDILDHRHKIEPRNRTRKRTRLLERRNTLESSNTLDSLLVTRPIVNMTRPEPINMIQNSSNSGLTSALENEIPELINPIPLINFRMRNFRF